MAHLSLYQVVLGRIYLTRRTAPPLSFSSPGSIDWSFCHKTVHHAPCSKHTFAASISYRIRFVDPSYAVEAQNPGWGCTTMTCKFETIDPTRTQDGRNRDGGTEVTNTTTRTRRGDTTRKGNSGNYEDTHQRITVSVARLRGYQPPSTDSKRSEPTTRPTPP